MCLCHFLGHRIQPLVRFDIFQEHDRMMLRTYHTSRLAGRIIIWTAPEPDPNPRLRPEHPLEELRNFLARLSIGLLLGCVVHESEATVGDDWSRR